jgi:type VI secretion system protein ImpK
LLEFGYACLALGFEGRYRDERGGRAQLESITARLATLIRPGLDVREARTLSSKWQGARIDRHKVLAVLPLWVVFAVGGVLLLAGFLFFNARLNALAAPVFRQIHSAPELARPERTSGVARPRLAPLLEKDIQAGLIGVRDEALSSTVTIRGDGLFAPGSATIEPRFVPVLHRIATALKDMPGQIVVIGHTDNAPVNSVRFPSNWHLSRDRARAVMAELIQAEPRADRLRAEGRADAEPIAANDSAANRAANRRIEISLLLPRPDS